MSTVFLIGNGFDLNCGLKTAYTDVYAEYIKVSSDNPVISRFKAEIESNYDNWCDFEKGMAEYAGKLESEDELLVCLRDFRSFLNSYLLRIENYFLRIMNFSLDIREAIEYECISSIKGFYKGITNHLTTKIEQSIPLMLGNISFISFNYTTVLDQILRFTYEGKEIPEIIHIHGTINVSEPDIVLGIDNEDQIKVKYALSKRSKRAFIKPVFNSEFDIERVERAQRLIKEARIICIYGMSLGVTDDYWSNYVLSVLIHDVRIELFLFQFDLSTVTGFYDEKMDIEDERKVILFDKWGLDINAEYYNRIHIPCGKNIFNMCKAIEKGKALQDKKARNGKSV